MQVRMQGSYAMCVISLLNTGLKQNVRINTLLYKVNSYCLSQNQELVIKWLSFVAMLRICFTFVTSGSFIANYRYGVFSLLKAVR